MDNDKKVATTEVAKKPNKKRYYNKKKVVKPTVIVEEVKTEIVETKNRFIALYNKVVTYIKTTWNAVINWFKK